MVKDRWDRSWSNGRRGRDGRRSGNRTRRNRIECDRRNSGRWRFLKQVTTPTHIRIAGIALIIRNKISQMLYGNAQFLETMAQIARVEVTERIVSSFDCDLACSLNC